jgi:pimeloyl-ACP methyl ester carboxylesterase
VWDYSVQFRTLHGYRRAFIRVGKGPALLLIHGIGDSSSTWEHLLPFLAIDHTVIAPDLLGHGASDKPRADYSVAGYANGMRDLLSVLGVDRVSVAMQFAYQYPERCERLVLISTGGVSNEVHPILRLASLPDADLLLPLVGYDFTRVAVRAVFKGFQKLGTDLGRDATDFLRVFDTLPDATARRAFVRTLRAVIDHRGQVITMLDRCYLTRGMPTLLVWGAHDAIIPISHARLAHAAMPGSRLEVFEEAGHFPHHAAPGRFLEVLRDFLATTEPAVHSSDQWRELLRRGRLGLSPPPSETDLGRLAATHSAIGT